MPANAKGSRGTAVVLLVLHTVSPDVQRFGYRRAHLRTVIELDSPHVVVLTHPDEVAAFIESAATEVNDTTMLTDPRY